MADRVAAPAVRLDYALPRSFLRRRWKRVILLALLGVAGAAAYARRGELRAAYDRYEYLRLQGRCLAFAAPPDRVVYDETPAAAARLGDPEYAKAYRTFADDPVTVCWRPRAFTEYWPTVRHPYGPPDDAAVVFLGERTSPSGDRRLLCVTVSLHTLLGSHRQILSFGLYAIEPATWRAAPAPRDVAVAHVIGPGPNDPLPFHRERLRIFAGQANPNDPAHLTFDYELGDRRGTIDGWIRDRVDSPGAAATPRLELVRRTGAP